MSEQDFIDAAPTIERIGRACDRISAQGFPEVHRGLAHYARHARGLIRRDTYPAVKARELLEFARQTEKLADQLESADARA